ncbi:hypothetical protein ACGFNV_44540 [Streptomyces sp. NPDC048751]|uniref:hypothetical protein n=1 Tax=Streptomyces sp. NPDC048751 TaxID=3365591 RepID=UPI003710ECF2
MHQRRVDAGADCGAAQRQFGEAEKGGSEPFDSVADLCCVATAALLVAGGTFGGATWFFHQIID